MLEKQYHDELNMELQGITYSASLSTKNLQSSVEDVQEDAPAESEQKEKDARDLSMVSMSRKKRRLYEAMQVLIHLSAQVVLNLVLQMIKIIISLGEGNLEIGKRYIHFMLEPTKRS